VLVVHQEQVGALVVLVVLVVHQEQVLVLVAYLGQALGRA